MKENSNKIQIYCRFTVACGWSLYGVEEKALFYKHYSCSWNRRLPATPSRWASAKPTAWPPTIKAELHPPQEVCIILPVRGNALIPLFQYWLRVPYLHFLYFPFLLIEWAAGDNMLLDLSESQSCVSGLQVIGRSVTCFLGIRGSIWAFKRVFVLAQMLGIGTSESLMFVVVLWCTYPCGSIVVIFSCPNILLQVQSYASILVFITGSCSVRTWLLHPANQ